MATTMKLKPIPGADKESAKTEDTAAPPATPAEATMKDKVAAYIESGADVATLTKLYLKLRNAEADLKNQAKAKMAPISDGMDLIENHFLAKMNELKVDSLKNAEGTPYKTKKTSITVADNDAWVDFVLTRALSALPIKDEMRLVIKTAMIESGQLALFEARASKTAVETLIEETKELPAGLNKREEYAVNVRKD